MSEDKVKGYTCKTSQTEQGKTVHDVSQARPEQVKDYAVTLKSECCLNLGNYQTLRISSERKGECEKEVAVQIYTDLLTLQKEFLKNSKQLLGG